MEPRAAISLYPPSAPLAIRARLSTEDSASDASSFAADSDGGGGADGGEDMEEEGFRTASEASEELEDGEASLALVLLPRLSSMPIARITGDDDDDDVLEEVEFDEEVQVNPKLPLENLVAERLSLDGGFVGGREESEFYAAVEEIRIPEKERKDVEELKKMASDIDDANADENGEVGNTSSGGLQRSVLAAEFKDVDDESSVMESEKTVDLIQKFDLMVELKDEEAEKEADKYVVDGEDAAHFVQIEAAAFADMSSRENWGEEAEIKALKAEFTESDIMKEEPAGQAESGHDLNKGNTEETCEHDSAECNESEAAELYGSELSKLDEDQRKAEKDKDLYVIADMMNSEASPDSAFEIHIVNDSHVVHEISSINEDISGVNALNHPEQEPIDVEDKHDGSGLFAAESFLCKNYNCWDVFSDRFSPFYVSHEENCDVYNEEDDYSEEEKAAISEWPARFAILDNSETAKYILKEMEEGSPSFGSSRDYSQILDSQMISNSDEDIETDEDGCAKELFHASALAALLQSASGSSGDFANLHSANIFTSSDLAIASEFDEDTDDEEKKLHLKVEQIRVKYLHLLQSLGYSPKDILPYQVLYRLGMAEGAKSRRQMSHEVGEKDNFSFSCNILILGKTGVGKSSVINSIFNEEKASTNPFEPATTLVREVSGMVDGVFIRVIDSPGLRTSLIDQGANRKILLSIKKFVTRFPPDIVLYIDRIDIHTLDFDDLPMLRMITNILGRSIWSNSIIAFTHAASALADGPDGSSLSYELFVAQRSHVVQQSIRQAAGDIRLLNPVALVENHPSCSRNEWGEMMLPNGLRWRPQLLLLCYSLKILSEVNSLLKLKVSSPKMIFRFRPICPLPFFLSALLQSKAHPKLSTQVGGDVVDFDGEQEDEYVQLPPFNPFSKSQIVELKNEQKKAYFDKYDHRSELLQKQHLKEEIKRLKNMEGRKEDAEDFEPANPAAVPVPLSGMVWPPSFDCDNPTYHYRFLEPTSHLPIRPVLDTHSWGHDSGNDGVSIQDVFQVANRFPMSIAVQMIKDKKKFSIHMDSSIAAKHGENGSTLTFFGIQPVGKQLAYTLQTEAKFENPKNSANTGISITFFGENMVSGLKLEDRVKIGKNLNLVASTGAVEAHGEVAYGANLEARLREMDCLIGQTLSSTLGLSLVKWTGEVALGADLKSQFSFGRNSKMEIGVGLNNRSNGLITIKTSSTEQLQIAFLGLFPFIFSICRFFWPGETNLAK